MMSKPWRVLLCWNRAGQQLLLDKRTMTQFVQLCFFFVFFPPTSAVVGAPLIQQHTREYLAPAAVEGVPGCPQLTADGRAEEWGGCRAALSRPAPRWL